MPAFSPARAPPVLTVQLRCGVRRSSTALRLIAGRPLLRYPTYSRSFTALSCSTS